MGKRNRSEVSGTDEGETEDVSPSCKVAKTGTTLFAVQEIASHLDTTIQPKGIPVCHTLRKNDCPLDCFLVYSCTCETTKLDYWLYVTIGFSDMFKKCNSNPNINGFGFELTFRLKKLNEQMPPQNPLALLNHLAKYVFVSKNVFSPGDFVPLSKDSLCNLTDSGRSELAHVLINKDPEIKNCSTVLGQVKFLQIVLVTDDELNTANTWFTVNFLDLLTRLPPSFDEHTVMTKKRMNPLFICDPHRKSVLSSSPNIKSMIEGCLSRFGSGTARLLCQKVLWTLDSTGTYTLTFPRRDEFDKVRQLLLYRVPYRRDFAIPANNDQSQGVLFLPCCELDLVGREKNWTQEELDKQESVVTHKDNHLIVRMSNSFCEKFCKHEYLAHKDQNSPNEAKAEHSYSWNECPKFVIRLIY